MSTSEADIAAQLIERLLGDPAFRAEFRRDPASACRKAGLDELADEMSIGAGKAMMTLDQRESKSSLAGVMMAAAMEGVGVYQFGEHILPHIDDVPSAVGDVLSRVSLPAIDLQGALAGGPDAPEAPPADAGAENGAGDAAAAAGGNGGAAAAPEAPPEAAPPEEAAAAGEKAGKGAGEAKEAALPPEQAVAGKAAAKIAAAESPEAKRAEEAQEAVAKIKEEAKDLPDANDLPEGPVAPQPVEEVGKGAGEPAPAGAPPSAAPPAAAPPAAVEPSGQPAPAAEPAHGGSQRIDPSQFGGEGTGTGGTPSPETLALLENKNVILDDVGIADLKAGRIDPRVVAVLTKLSQEHEIKVSCMCSDHSKFTSGGSVSNHFYGRGLDIASVDGEIVNPGSAAARELLSEFQELDPDYRPDEVGSPWAISGPGYFTDAAHQDHLHLGFKTEIDPNWKPPADVAAGAPTAAPGAPVAAAAAVPGQPVAAAAAAAEPKAKPGDSMSFRAVTAEDATAAKPKKGDSLGFIQAVQPQQPAAPVASAAAVDPTAAAGVPADLSGVPDAYPGDDAPPEQMAAWMAKQAEARGLPPELPVMASLVESGLKNLNFGHADSVGFFQMRVGIWNQGEYAGFPEKPELQVKWFLDNAETVKKARIAAGKPVDDPSSYGEWIADVERPAEQYRYKYQTKLEEAQGLLEKAPQGNAAAPAAAPPAAVETPGAPPVEPQGRAGGSQKIDPSQFGGEGTGGTPSPETLALLKNKNITFDETGISDLEAGRIDPRVVAVLTKLSQDHELKISCMCSDHSKMTAGGSISNHFHGRGVDIAAVDGEIVNPGSAAARELATEMQEIAADYRPDEIGTPWAINGPGYFTDAGHQDHLHLGFKTEIDPNWKPPADVAAGGAAPAAAGAPVAAAPAAPVASAVAAPGQPAAAAAVAQPKAKPGDSLSFRAVTAEDAAEAAAPKQGDELSFMQPPAGPPQFLAPAGAVPAPVADAAAATAAGGSGLGASALEIAKQELAAGVKEEGTNSGAKVDEYLASAGVGPGNPWCASFVTWALEKSGRKMDGGGWAAVQTWVRAAEAKTNDLEIVSAEDARPGDLVVYDWGGQEDFGADGHIGFLQSNVQDGKFTALEGNYRDAVLSVPRQTTGANVKFIRINGDAPAGAPAPSAPVAPAAPPSGPAVMGALDDGSAQARSEAAAGTPPPARPAPAAGAVGAAADAAAPAAGGGEAGPKALAAIAEARKYMGTAYKWGGSTPDTGFDCSGLVQWAYAKAGIELPRVTYDQIDKGTDVPIDQLRPGDLVFFGPKDNPWHVGIALGDGKFLHAPKTGDVVKVTELEGYWESEFAGARRIDDSAPVEGAASAPAAAASAAPAAAAPVDPNAVAKAQAAVERDAAEVKKGNTMMFMAVKAQEADRQQRMTVQFMKAVDPKQQVGSPAAAAAAAVAPPEVAAAAGAGPTAAEDAAANQAVGAPVPEGELALQNVGPIGTYPGDNASQAELAQWLASEAKKAGLPPELPVMASLVESGVKNLKGGDADSAGFFQMRVGIWDNGPYKGFRMNPQLQAKWFIDNALQVKKARLAAGKSVTDPGSYGEWIADVERPAAQYRYKYQLRLTEARKLLGG